MLSFDRPEPNILRTFDRFMEAVALKIKGFYVTQELNFTRSVF
jgi:hypothetical protein